MTQATILRPGDAFAHFSWPKVGGGNLDVAGETGWRILMVYRGKHCPLCKRYFKALDNKLELFHEMGVAIYAVSADPKEKAEADVAAEGWRFPVAYDLSLDNMRNLGLFISAPRSPQETDRPFSEPGMFVVNPDGNTQTIQRGNASYTRPDLDILLAGIKATIEKGLPIRGMLG